VRGLVIALVLALAALSGLEAQTAAASAPAATPGAVAASPYQDQEFEPWVLKVRRAEVLAVGAFPLAYLFAGLGYDYTYYLSKGFPQENAPWPVGPGTSLWTTAQPELLQKKNLALLGWAVGASLVLAAADWVLGL